jgi:hypothetical protein
LNPFRLLKGLSGDYYISEAVLENCNESCLEDEEWQGFVKQIKKFIEDKLVKVMKKMETGQSYIKADVEKIKA